MKRNDQQRWSVLWKKKNVLGNWINCVNNGNLPLVFCKNKLYSFWKYQWFCNENMHIGWYRLYFIVTALFNVCKWLKK